MIAVMLSVCVCLFVVFFFLAVNMHLSACWECFFFVFFFLPGVFGVYFT